MVRHITPRRYPLLEWVSAAIGLAISVALFGFLTVEALHPGEQTPPVLNVVPVGILAQGDRYLVEVDVTNAAHRTAAGVQVEGTLKQGESTVETSGASLVYVPGESKARAGLIFTRDPRKLELELRVTGYERP